MANIFIFPDGEPYDIKTDWNNMINHTEDIMDFITSRDLMTLITSGDTSSLTDFMGYETFVKDLNFTKIIEGMEMVVSEDMTMQDLDK